jgi:hypothetical protein
MANTSTAHKADLQRVCEAMKRNGRPRLWRSAGPLPSIILDKQPALGISSLDLNILLQLAKYWWKKDDLPYPSKETLAELHETPGFASAIPSVPSLMRKPGRLEMT